MKINDEMGDETNRPRKPNWSGQTFFAGALLVLWLLVYLAVHFHVLKD